MAKIKKINKTDKSNQKEVSTNSVGSKKTNKMTKKRSAESMESDNEDKFEDLGQSDTWDWNEVVAPENTFMGDDSTGFLCLEEISDVEVDYEGDDKTGKIVTFKRKKKANRKASKKATPTQPLSEKDMGDFYDLDTFTEEAFLAQQNQGGVVDSGSSLDNVADQDNNEEKEDISDTEDQQDRIDDDSLPTTVTTQKAAKAMANKKEKAKRYVEKLKIRIEKLEKEMESIKNHADQTKEEKLATDKETIKKRQLLKKLRSHLKKLEKDVNEEEKVESKATSISNRPKLEDVDENVDISAWNDMDLSEPIINALKYYKFCEPTQIQAKALPKALERRDIIGVAETGSGKTLAFGIPMVDSLLRQKERSPGLAGLVLAPTRELAIQVKDHIQNIAVFGNIKVVAVVGGMSIQKQQRQLKEMPDIIVATPGRLWELLSTNQVYMDMLKSIKFLVLDEADRMLEKGHFEELSKLLGELSSKRQNTTEWPEDIDGNERKIIERDVGIHQTFIFTATLDKGIVFNVKSKKAPPKSKGTLADLVRHIEFADENPVVVNVTSEKKVASRLVEAKVDCLKTDKDLYVYYLVTRYPGRTIIFVNSIDAIRRLVPIFKLLGIEVLGLHAQMQQKQRLKNLDRFKANDKAVLVASDVAARGLDIPLVEHVIHYQLPRSGEIYVHRSGRTARANRDGISLLLCGPDEVKILGKLVQTLRKGEKYPDFPVDLSILRAMKKRVQLATEIDKIEHQENKMTHDDNWMRNMAKEMDLEFDEDMISGNGKQENERQLEKERAKARSLRYELKELLKTPMLPDGASMKYLTGSAISGLIDRLIENEAQPTLLPAHATSKAVDDVKSHKKRKL